MVCLLPPPGLLEPDNLGRDSDSFTMNSFFIKVVLRVNIVLPFSLPSLLQQSLPAHSTLPTIRFSVWETFSVKRFLGSLSVSPLKTAYFNTLKSVQASSYQVATATWASSKTVPMTRICLDSRIRHLQRTVRNRLSRALPT